SPKILPGPLLDFGASGLYVELCHSVSPCIKNLKMVAENPMEIHYVEVEIIDVNDNSPSFQEDEKILEISESTLSGRRFQLPTARDPDVAGNAIRAYKLNHSDYFAIHVRERGDDKVPFLVLQKSLDREKHQVHKLLMSAVDGGNPPRSGTLNVTVIVLDSNDNHPTFSQEIYSVTIPENVETGTSVITIKATDLDEGSNGDIEYFFGGEVDPKLYEVFNLNKDTGEIKVKGDIDFEEADIYKLHLHATDKGHIDVADVNDNKPEFLNNPIGIYLVENNVPGNPIFSQCRYLVSHFFGCNLKCCC
uniref:Cadherin domain-containing protein n=1 Tax=Salarias fasciatus TaxID=181472 RepID=A0A672GA20_SALFA